MSGRMTSLETSLEKLVQLTANFMQKTGKKLDNQGASIRNLEIQLGQISRQLAERPPKTLPLDTIMDPKEQSNAITLRGGKSYEGPRLEAKLIEEAPPKTQFAKDVAKQVSKDTSPKEEHPRRKKKKDQIFDKPYVPSPYEQVPYPQLPSKEEQDKYFETYMGMTKQLQINLPLIETLNQMPSYIKFFKELLTKTRKPKDYEEVAMSEECNYSKKATSKA